MQQSGKERRTGMTYKELYDKADWMLDKGMINLGEWEKMIEPLNAEIGSTVDVELNDLYKQGEMYLEDLQPKVKLVFCKDCINYRTVGCPMGTDINHEEDYCSYGETAE